MSLLAPPPRRRRAGALAALLSGAALLAGAPAALGAPSAPPGLSASTGPATTSDAATFTWGAATPAEGSSIIRYEGGLGEAIATLDSFSETVRLAPGAQTFRVRAVEVDPAGVESPGPFAAFTVVSDGSAPSITGALAPGLNRFGWATRPVTVSFSCADPQSGIESCTAPVTVGEGADQARAGTARNGVGTESSVTVTGINVDATPPGLADLRAPAAGAIVTDRRVALLWGAATDATSGVVGYQVFIDNPRGSGQAPFVTGPGYTTGELGVGRHTWFVRSIDVARNTSDSELREFVIAAPPPSSGGGAGGDGAGGGSGSVAGGPGSGGAGSGGPSDPAAPPQPEETTTGGGRTVLRPPTQNARALSPRAGLRVRTLRPVLRWSSMPRGTTLANVQLFRMRGRNLTKVHSAFPRSTRYRVPDGILRPGEIYVWRVWPFRGRRGFTPRPLGVSWFRLGGVADLLPAAARARMTAPARTARGQALAVSWRARPGIRRYKVTLQREGRPVYSDLAVGTRATIPGRALVRRGTYAVIVRSARTGSLRRFTSVPWAAAAVRVR